MLVQQGKGVGNTMIRIRMITLGLLAMLVLGAVLAQGASAGLLEVGKCEAQANGRYEDAACTVAAHPRRANGHYEWHNAAKIEEESGCTNCGVGSFDANLEQDGHGPIGPTTFETPGGNKIAGAHRENFRGDQAEVFYRFKGAQAVSEVFFHFTNCKEAGGEEKECYSPNHHGNGEGGTITNEEQWLEEEAVKGKLVFLSGKGTPTPTVGLDLVAFEPKSERNEQRRFVTVECEGSMGTVWIGGGTKKPH